MHEQVRRRRAMLLGIVATAMPVLPLLTGCGGSHDAASDAAIAASAPSTFELGALPRPPESSPLGPATHKGDTSARSYEVRGKSPRGVLAFYTDKLGSDGWTAVGRVRQLGASTFRGDWRKDGWNLRVSSSGAPTLGTSDAGNPSPATQYSLVLTRS